MPPHDGEGDVLTIGPLQAQDWPRIAAIYGAGIASGSATFETEVPPWQDWNRAHHEEPRLAARARGELVGWATLSPVSTRDCYRGVAEVSIYVDPRFGGRGVGTRLLGEMVSASERCGFWTLQGMLFPENEPSVRILERCGFRRVGTRSKLGRLRGEWRDVQLMERRSPS